MPAPLLPVKCGMLRPFFLLLALLGSPASASGSAFNLLQQWSGLGQAPIALSPDGRLLALTRPARRTQAGYAPYDTRIEVRDTATMRRLYRVPAANGDGKTLLFSPDSRTLWSAHSGTLHYDAWTGKLKDNREGSDGAGVSALAFAPDGQSYVLAGVNAAGQTRLGRLAAGHWKTFWPSLPPSEGDALKPNWISALAFSPDGKRVASGSLGGGVVLRSAVTGRPLRVLSGVPGKAAHRARLVGLLFLSPRQLLSASADGQLRLWDTVSGQNLTALALSGQLRALAPAAGGRVAAATTGGLHLLAVSGGRLRLLETVWGDYADVEGSAAGDLWAITRNGTLSRWRVTP